MSLYVRKGEAYGVAFQGHDGRYDSYGSTYDYGLATFPDVLAWLREQWRCTTCGGSGVWHLPASVERCPDCVDGWVIPDEMVEAMATAIDNEVGSELAHLLRKHPRLLFGVAEQALVAWLTALEAE